MCFDSDSCSPFGLAVDYVIVKVFFVVVFIIIISSSIIIIIIIIIIITSHNYYVSIIGMVDPTSVTVPRVSADIR